MKVIGITGGIGAGKSLILNYLQERHNALILMTDEIAHDVMEPGGLCYDEMRALFPASVFTSDGHIDRAKMAAVLYGDDELRTRLNSIVHPAVGEYLKEKVTKERQKCERDYVIIESALYDGTGFALLCDEVWNINASKECRKARLMESRGYSEAKVESIFESQAGYDEMRQTLRTQIDNNGDINLTYAQIEEALSATD